MSAGATIKLRRDTAQAWHDSNPIIASGEPGLETDTNLIKYGNGVTHWRDLPYANLEPAAVTTSIVPAANTALSLGAPDAPWGELYLSGNSIYLGDVILSSEGSTLYVNGAPMPDFSTAMVDRGADNNNWNLITTMGVYTVNRTSWSGVTGAPLDSQIFKGTLEVTATTNNVDTAISQIYYPAQTNNDPAVQFTRSNWNGGWTNWFKMLNDKQVVSGGLF
jgi:hypothetical protein